MIYIYFVFRTVYRRFVGTKTANLRTDKFSEYNLQLMQGKLENAFISMWYLHKGQNKFTYRTRKECKYHLEVVGVKLSLKQVCSLTRAVCLLSRYNAS
jgi:hypothetical protein